VVDGGGAVVVVVATATCSRPTAATTPHPLTPQLAAKAMPAADREMPVAMAVAAATSRALAAPLRPCAGLRLPRQSPAMLQRQRQHNHLRRHRHRLLLPRRSRQRSSGLQPPPGLASSATASRPGRTSPAACSAAGDTGRHNRWNCQYSITYRHLQACSGPLTEITGSVASTTPYPAPLPGPNSHPSPPWRYTSR